MSRFNLNIVQIRPTDVKYLSNIQMTDLEELILKRDHTLITRSGTIGFVRASGGQITTFDIAGGNFTEGRSINASGVITGVTAATDPFVDTKGFLRFP